MICIKINFLSFLKQTAEDVDSVPIHSLKVHFNIIRETIDFAQLLPQLYQDRILSYEEEIAKIQSENSRALQTMSLVHMIEKKGKAGVKGFIESLERETTNIGHRDLAQELKNGNIIIIITSLYYGRKCLRFESNYSTLFTAESF